MDITNSLRIVPSDHSTPPKSVVTTATSLGVHDTFRYGVKSIQSEISPAHPLENRIKQWDETQTNLKLHLERRLYGLHAPVRHLMERSIVSKVFNKSPVLPSSNFGLEILTGKDGTIDFEDFLNDPEMSTESIDFHGAMEQKLGIKI